MGRAGIAVRVGLTILVLLLLAPTLIPPFLDRVYYRGPASSHYDGHHFFNPDGDPDGGGKFSTGRILRFLRGGDRVAWPKSVPVTSARPLPRIPAPGMAADAMRVIWVGHSSVLVQADCLNILTDPVWSDVVSPLPPLGPRRVRAPGIRFEDLPRIDLVLLSHDHYDHLDLPTLARLAHRDHPLIATSLGNDRLLADHGIEGAVARDWGGRIMVPAKPGCAAAEVIVERVHHWDSRWGSDRNRALWSGFTVRLPGGNLFFAGDTGMGDGRWPGEAAARGPIRLALLPIGAYLPPGLMKPSHVDPTEAVEIFERLHAANALAVHWGTFQLSNEAIDAPPRLLAATLRRRGIAADRFRATEAGVAWDVPGMAGVPSRHLANRPTPAHPE